MAVSSQLTESGSVCIYTHICAQSHIHTYVYFYMLETMRALWYRHIKSKITWFILVLLSSHICIFLLSDKSVPTVLSTLEWNKSLNYVGYVFIHGTVESHWFLPAKWPTDSYLSAMAETSDPTSPGSVQANNIFLYYTVSYSFTFSFKFYNEFIYVFVFGCTGSSLLCAGFL